MGELPAGPTLPAALGPSPSTTISPLSPGKETETPQGPLPLSGVPISLSKPLMPPLLIGQATPYGSRASSFSETLPSLSSLTSQAPLCPLRPSPCPRAHPGPTAPAQCTRPLLPGSWEQLAIKVSSKMAQAPHTRSGTA